MTAYIHNDAEKDYYEIEKNFPMNRGSIRDLTLSCI